MSAPDLDDWDAAHRARAVAGDFSVGLASPEEVAALNADRPAPWGTGKTDAEIEAEAERIAAEWEAKRDAEKVRTHGSIEAANVAADAEFRERVEAGMLADLRADLARMDGPDFARAMHADPTNEHVLAERDRRLAAGGQDDLEFWGIWLADKLQVELVSRAKAKREEFEAYKREHPNAHAEAWASNLDEYKALLENERIAHEAEVEKELKRLRIRDEAQRLFRLESAPPPPTPPVVDLAEMLSRPVPVEKYVVDRLWPVGGKVLLSAVRKAGKSTTVADLTRALADGGKFLDEFGVPEARRVTILDFELTPAMLQRWLARQGIRNLGNVRVVELVGKARTFDILNDRTRAEWAERLAGTDVLILDPLAPLMASLGLDEWRDGGKVTAAFDALRTEAGIAEGIIVHHEGHSGTHARGDSALEGWPDALWRLTREDANDPSSFRYFEGQGREVGIPRGLVSLDDKTGRLSFLAEASKAKRARQVDLVFDALKAAGKPLRTDEIIALGIPGVSKNTAATVLTAAVDSLRVTFTTGPKGVKLYSPAGVI